jgi:hypothetical protein
MKEVEHPDPDIFRMCRLYLYWVLQTSMADYIV